MELEEGSLDLCLGAPVPGLDEAGHGHEEPHDGHGDSVLLLSAMVKISTWRPDHGITPIEMIISCDSLTMTRVELRVGPSLQ